MGHLVSSPITNFHNFDGQALPLARDLLLQGVYQGQLGCVFSETGPVVDQAP